MVDFKPFSGFIPNLSDGEGIEERVSPPYDVLEGDELLALQRKRYNVTRITLGGSEGSYLGAAKSLMDWIAEGTLIQDEESFYLYRQTFTVEGKTLTRTGLVGLLRLEGYEEGNIIPHEETMPKVKEDRLALLRDTATHAESIFGIYERDSMDVDDLISSAEPLFECESMGVIHSFLRISDEDSKRKIVHTMERKRILIADGHHRFETALRYSREHPGDERRAYVLATLVSAEDEGMIVLPTHRIVKSVAASREEIIRGLSRRFEVEDIMDFDRMIFTLEGDEGTSFGILTKDGRMAIARLVSPPDDDVLWSIDAYACQELLFKSVLKLNNPEIEYEERSHEVLRKMSSGDYDLAVLLPAPTLDDIWRVARAGRKMPKKSTFFYPKIWSGFVYHRMV